MLEVFKLKCSLIGLLCTGMTIFGPALANAGFSFGFNDPRFVADPYQPFYAYQMEELAQDLVEIEKKGGPLEKDPVLMAELQNLVDEVYNGYKRMYPRFMANKAMPGIAILRAGDETSIAAAPSRLIDPHGIIVATVAFLKAAKQRTAKLGVIAHEMAHLFLGHNPRNHILIHCCPVHFIG